MAFNKNYPSLWQPGRELSRLQNEIDRLFQSFLEPAGERRVSGQSFFAPACDVQETDRHYLLSFDLPGLTKEDVKIELDDHDLVVRGERKEEHEAGEGKSYTRERFFGAFERRFTLPQSVNPDEIEASYENGVLEIAVPKAAEQTAKKEIEIKQTGGLLGKILKKGEGKKEKAA